MTILGTGLFCRFVLNIQALYDSKNRFFVKKISIRGKLLYFIRKFELRVNIKIFSFVLAYQGKEDEDASRHFVLQFLFNFGYFLNWNDLRQEVGAEIDCEKLIRKGEKRNQLRFCYLLIGISLLNLCFVFGAGFCFYLALLIT